MQDEDEVPRKFLANSLNEQLCEHSTMRTSLQVCDANLLHSHFVERRQNKHRPDINIVIKIEHISFFS